MKSAQQNSCSGLKSPIFLDTKPINFGLLERFFDLFRHPQLNILVRGKVPISYSILGQFYPFIWT